METMTQVVTLLLMGVLWSAPTWVQADDPPAPQPAPETDKKDEKKIDEWKPPQPEKWASLQDANFTMGFAKEWTVSEEPNVIMGNPADKKIVIIAKVVAAKTAQEAMAYLQEDLGGYLAGIKITDPEFKREENGLKVLATGGTATQRRHGRGAFRRAGRRTRQAARR